MVLINSALLCVSVSLIIFILSNIIVLNATTPHSTTQLINKQFVATTAIKKSILYTYMHTYLVEVQDSMTVTLNHLFLAGYH